MTSLRMKCFLLLYTLFCTLNSAFACTDFRLIAKDGTVLITRSMEYALDLQSNLRTSNRGRAFNTKAPDGTPGLSWKAKYGYVYLDGLNADFAVDGMNEKGLSFEALYLPGLSGYQTVPQGQSKQVLPYFNMGDWVLSNFSTVEEVRQALAHVFVVSEKLPVAGDLIFPLHFSIFEPTGKGIIIEYINGKLSVYDNQVGILTNSPSYDWHIMNLNNYVHLTPINPSPVVDGGVTFAATGQGFGMIGLPGDISPPSRFVKMATLTRVVIPAIDAAGVLNLAEHIINNVDIPRGLARQPVNGMATNETTQWVVFKDLMNKIFYYRTYENMTLRAVSLAKVNFDENAPRLKMPIASSGLVQDVTDQFLKSDQQL